MVLKWDVKRDPLTNAALRQPLQLDYRLDFATNLHKTFYTALSNGDKKALQEICCDGLLRTARTRIEKRKALHASYEPWALTKYVGLTLDRLNFWPVTAILPGQRFRVVSDRIAPLPMPDSYIRQCVVRIVSKQTYWLADSPKQVTAQHDEYVVIQQMTSKGESGLFRLWGITEPTTMEEIDDMLESKGHAAGTTLAERIRDKMSSMAGVQ
jgi:hypothetical protein